MNKVTIVNLQDYVEETSQYMKLVRERIIDEADYETKFQAVKEGLACLKIPDEPLKAFEGRKNLVIHLGAQLPQYTGAELPLYIGLKKTKTPQPEDLAEKCPKEITALLDQMRSYKYINEYAGDLTRYSLSPDIFLAIHRSILNCRVESLMPTLLVDLERVTFKTLDDIVKKIPSVYLDYLTPPSLGKLIKKIAALLQMDKARMSDELKNIDLYSSRLKEQMNGLYQETNAGLQEIMQNDVDKGSDVDKITQRIANLFGRVERLFLGNIYHLKEYEAKRDGLLKLINAEEELKYWGNKKVTDRRKKVSEIYNEYLFVNKYGTLTQPEDRLFVKNLTQAFEELHHQKNKDLPLLNKFEHKALLGVELDFEAVQQAYHDFAMKTIIPHFLAQCLFDLVQCLPPKGDEPIKVIQDIGNLRVISLQGTNILEVRDRPVQVPKEIVSYVENFRKSITVLVYDIRGSSYMGIKLHDAQKEQKIKYKFAKEMAEIAKKYNAFLLKDTGDGGIVWFAENSGSLYDHLYAESVTGRGTKLRYSIFSGGEFELNPAADSAKRAILCARDMVLKAEEFIKANFMHYREWFAAITERTMEVEGVTYALLPPEFKSLFRIGIGLSTGIPGTDVVIAANSYGDPDLVGPILADAHLYSMERQPGRSVIICDMPTYVNHMLNVETFEYPIQENDFERYVKRVEETKKTYHPYVFADYKISVVPRGTHVLEEVNKQKALTDEKIPAFFIGDDKIIYNEQHLKIKPLFEVLNIQ